MSGYRQSSFDPSSGGDYGPPLRPYNWVQWTGVVSLFIGAAILLAYFGGRIGLLPKLLDSPTPGTAFIMISIALINSRREPIPLSPETKRRRTLIVIAALGVCAIAIAAGFYFSGGLH